MESPESRPSQNEPFVKVDHRICKACGLCIAFCPRKVLKVSDSVNSLGYRATAYAGTGCIGCGICYDLCPEIGVITVYPRGSAPGATPEEKDKP